MTTIGAIEFLDKKAGAGFGAACLDVRSEGEFATGYLPGFVNLPILCDPERHQVGLAYKTQGRELAIQLGHELVDPTRVERVGAWSREIDRSQERAGFVACWRGGLRSGIASRWIQEAGKDVIQIQGGYKAIRHELIAPLLTESPSVFSALRIISGFTGSGKTRFFRTLASAGDIDWLDLEGHAKHRGSSFGRLAGDPTPAQATFENLVGWDFYRMSSAREIWLEDESRCIGAVRLPDSLKTAMNLAPVLFLEVSMETRQLNIFEEYVAEPLKNGTEPKALLAELERCTLGVRKRLGGAMTSEVVGDLRAAFEGLDGTPDRHFPWIKKLLVHYYDPAYQYAFDLHKRPILFRGDENACRQWIQTRSV